MLIILPATGEMKLRAEIDLTRSKINIVQQACQMYQTDTGGCGPSQDESAEQPKTRKAPPGAAGNAAPETKPAPFVPKPIHISAAGSVDFDINWPPRPPAPRKPSRGSLLTGQLLVRGDTSRNTDPKMTVTLVLTRPHAADADRDRESWNSETAFRQYKSWMPYARGRDANGAEWLWPNLAYLFKSRGTDRVERYGGWDRGHKADNDFGGVLIRKYNASGAVEYLRLFATKDPARPLAATKCRQLTATA